MITNKIILEFPTTISRISGNVYGQSIYEKQIKHKLDDSSINEIHFPDHITRISISFMKGLMSEQLSKYGKESIFDHFMFTSSHPDIEKSIKESINF